MEFGMGSFRLVDARLETSVNHTCGTEVYMEKAGQDN
jgi:hypothetical protein